jgi:hypothetical protein
MSLNVSSYEPRIAEQTQVLATLFPERTEYFNPITSHALSGGSWHPPSNIRSVWQPSRRRKQTRKQRKANKARARDTAASYRPTVVMGFKELDLSMTILIRNLTISDDYTRVLVQALIDPGVTLSLTLHNEQREESNNYEIKSVSIRFEASTHTSRAHFVESSLYAMLALAGPISIVLPEMNVDISVSFDLPLFEISSLLQSRQTYYGLMVIEKSTGIRFSIPEYITADNMASISFVYYSIIERTFDWLANFITLPVPATQEILSWLNNLNPIDPDGAVYKMAFGPTLTARTIFDQLIVLGPETVFVDDALLTNRDEIREELAQLDGHEMSIVFRPLSGMGRYELPEAPRLPMKPWDEALGRFIDLEGTLNERLAASYNALAFATVRGLSQEEIASITTRPEINYEHNQDEQSTDVIK